MHKFTQKLKPVKQTESTSAMRSSGEILSQQRFEKNSILHLQHILENQALQRLLPANADNQERNSNTPTTDRFAHDFSRIPVYPQAPAKSGAKISASLDGIQARSLHDLRVRVSHITGVDVRSVPVEKGDARGKRAVTHEAQVTLGLGATEHDIAHELAHAAQQRAFSGSWLDAGTLERRADEVAAVAISDGSATVMAGRAPSASILAAGDPYSRETVSLPAPPPGATVKDLEDQLKLKINAGDITGYAVSGVKPGDPEELFLFNALVRLANQKRWGSEMDLVTSIGSGKGLVTVRFNAAGKAEAQLVGKSEPVVQATFTKEQDAIDALVAKYKLVKVSGEKGKKWSLDELNKVSAAWARLSTVEADALAGYSLIRTDTLSQGGESLQGQTTHTDEVKTGQTTVTHLREIRFADSLFAADDKSFIGDAANAAPASFETLIHEVGHALEAKPFDDLNASAVDDAAKANQSGAAAHTEQVATNKAINTALKGKYLKTEAAAAQPLFDAVSATQKTLQGFEQSPDAVHEATSKKAIADRDVVKAPLPPSNKAVIALATAITAQDKYFTALGKFLAATDAAAASRAKAGALKSGTNTKRLQAFVDFVTKENIMRPTQYAEKHWPMDPAEFFNEAFSLWKNDPVFFGKYSTKLKAWFDAGNHLK